MHIEILRHKPDTPQHTIRARLSEAVSDGLLDRLGDGFYDLYAEDQGMTSVASHPNRCPLWGSSRYRGNCDGRLIRDLVLRYNARKVADPMEGSGTSRDVVNGLNQYRRLSIISYWGGDLRTGFGFDQTGPAGNVRPCLDPPAILEHRAVQKRHERLEQLQEL